MSQQLEIEFKNLLTKTEYQQLIEFFNVSEDEVIKQVNIYFDTIDELLKRNHSALRVRIKDGVFELTLKQPSDVGLLETTEYLTNEQYNDFLNNGTLSTGPVATRLNEIDLNQRLQVLAELTTYRYETPYNVGLLVLDHSIYYNCEDYELEFEVDDFEEGQKAFEKLLIDFHIPRREASNKISRAYQEKHKLDTTC